MKSISFKCFLMCLMLISTSLAGFAASGPRYAVENAHEAAEKGKLNKLREELTGEALSRYGSVSGMTALRNEIAPYKSIKMKKELVRTELDAQGNDQFRIYDVSVTGKNIQSGEKELFQQPIVNCDVTRKWSPESCRMVCHGPHDDEFCDLECTGGFWIEEESCKVAQFNRR